MTGLVGDFAVIGAYNYATGQYKSIKIDSSELCWQRVGGAGLGWMSNVNGFYLYEGWLRTHGQNGWYNETYQGGWYMTDHTYMRSYNNKSVAAADFVATSDERLKTGIVDMPSRGRLRPRDFFWIKSGAKDFGFIAQEVEVMYPEAVGIVMKDGVEGHKVVSYPKLTAVLAAQLNDAMDQIAVMRAELDMLKERI